MSDICAIIGAGRQGIAAAYDLAKFGDVDEIILADINFQSATAGAQYINKLLEHSIVRPVQTDASDIDKLEAIIEGAGTVISGVHFPFNSAITDIAIRFGANMFDFGGNTDIVRKQLSRDNDAKAAGVVIVPDCGMGPGLNVSLATYVMSLLDEPREVHIWDGGLPQNPKSPWNYACTFSIEGLTNEYYGNAYFLRGGKITEVPCFEGLETIDFPTLGKLEAFVTSGGLSTAPWTFEGKLERLENKTLRYPGHYAQLKAFAELGLFGLEPIKIDGIDVVPRDVFHTLFGPQITESFIKDVCAMRVKCIGKKDGKSASATVELIDYYDDKTGFTAMQRLTGWHASIMAILALQNGIPAGVNSVESAAPGKVIADEFRKRGIDINEKIDYNE